MSVGDQAFDSFKKIISDLEGDTEEDTLFPSGEESTRIGKFVDVHSRGFAFENDTTVDFEEIDMPSKFEAMLHDTVRSTDTLVALGSEELRQHLALSAIKHYTPGDKGLKWVVVLVRSVEEEKSFKEYLDILLYLKVVTSDSVQKEEKFREACLKYDLLFFDPDFFLACLMSNRIAVDEISLIVFNNFENFLQMDHPYRSITSFIRKRQVKNLRVLGLVDHLSCTTLKDLEEQLKSMKEAFDWTCLLACFRPYGLRVGKSLNPILFCANQDKTFVSNLTDILKQLDSREGTLVLQTLKQYGPLCAQDEAEDLMYNACVDKQTKIVLEKFLNSTKMALLTVKLDKLGSVLKSNLTPAKSLNPTLILTKNLDTYGKVKSWLEENGPKFDFPCLSSFDSSNIGEFSEASTELLERHMFLATFGDVPALERFAWPSVILFDLPKLVYCDGLLRKVKKVFAITSSTKWHEWEEGLFFYDALEKIMQRINSDLMSVD